MAFERETKLSGETAAPPSRTAGAIDKNRISTKKLPDGQQSHLHRPAHLKNGRLRLQLLRRRHRHLNQRPPRLRLQRTNRRRLQPTRWTARTSPSTFLPSHTTLKLTTTRHGSPRTPPLQPASRSAKFAMAHAACCSNSTRTSRSGFRDMRGGCTCLGAGRRCVGGRKGV